MSTLKLRTLLIVLILMGWGSQLVYLSPTPATSIQAWYDYALSNFDSYIWRDFSPDPRTTSEANKREYIESKYGGRIWTRWLFHLSLIGLGLTSIILIKLRKNAIYITSLILSVLYFAFWGTQPGGLLFNWSKKLQIAKTENVEIFFFHKQLVLPIVFIAICGISLWCLRRARLDRPTS